MSATTGNTVTLYRTTCTRAYMMAEQGSAYSLDLWYGNDEYEGYDDGGAEYTLPAGYEVAESVDGCPGIAGPDDMMCHILADEHGLPALVGSGGDLITLRRVA